MQATQEILQRGAGEAMASVQPSKVAERSRQIHNVTRTVLEKQIPLQVERGDG